MTNRRWLIVAAAVGFALGYRAGWDAGFRNGEDTRKALAAEVMGADDAE